MVRQARDRKRPGETRRPAPQGSRRPSKDASFLSSAMLRIAVGLKTKPSKSLDDLVEEVSASLGLPAAELRSQLAQNLGLLARAGQIRARWSNAAAEPIKARPAGSASRSAGRRPAR